MENNRKQLKGEPLGQNGKKHIYRARSSKDKFFNPMDYVTLSYKFALEHAQHQAAVTGEDQIIIMGYADKNKIFQAPNTGEYFYDDERPLEGKIVKVIKGLEEKKKKKGDRCIRIAKRKYDVWPSAYASGAVVKCRQGKIWKGLSEEELNEMIEEEVSKELSRLATSDQQLRNVWADWLDQRGGWSEELVDEFAKKYGTSKDDLFNDTPTQEEFKKIFSMISDEDFNQFTDEDWDNFHIIVQHMDNDIETQKKAREILKKFNRTEQYKYLDDRINCAEFGKQLYGTQNGCEQVDTLDEKKKPDFKKEKESGLHGWFSRQGGKGKSKGWVDCNTCRTDKETGKKTCKTCGRKEGEKRSKYPACRPKPSDCGSSGKGEDWGKKSVKEASYPGNLGVVEMFKLRDQAPPEVQKQFDDAIDADDFDKAWEILQAATGTKLHSYKSNKIKIKKGV